MIVVEFVIFVVSSGVFYSERFRRNMYAVVAAGALAAGSSVLFFWHLAERWSGQPETSPVQIVRQIVEKPAPEVNSDPSLVGSTPDCREHYPFWSRLIGDSGVTELAFKVLSNGTVASVQVTKGSGSSRLDDAAMECVSSWHYRPALRKGKIADVPWTAKVVWGDKPEEKKPDDPPATGEAEN